MIARLTSADRRGLAALDLYVPRHPEDLHRRDKVRPATLHRLCSDGWPDGPLARLLELKPACWLRVPYVPFYVLTAAGVAARKAGA